MLYSSAAVVSRHQAVRGEKHPFICLLFFTVFIYRNMHFPQHDGAPPLPPQPLRTVCPVVCVDVFKGVGLEGEKVKLWPVLGCDGVDKLSSA